MAVRPGARAAAAGLDPEQVVEQRDHEVVVQVAALVADDERDDRQPLRVGAAEDLDRGVGRPARHRPPDEVVLALADGLDADGVLELEHEARPDRLDDRRRAALLAVLDVGQVDVLERVHVLDRAAAGHARDAVLEQVPAGDEHARRPRPADELVGADEHRVLVGERVVGRVHLDPHVRRRGREVEERERAVLVEQPRDRVRVRGDAGHVRGGRERPDLRAAGRRSGRARPRSWSRSM